MVRSQVPSLSIFHLYTVLSNKKLLQQGHDNSWIFNEEFIFRFKMMQYLNTQLNYIFDTVQLKN